MHILNHCILVDRSVVYGIFYQFRIIVNRGSCHVSDGPRNERAVAVLAVYVSMDVLLSNLAVLGETVTKTCGVKNRTGTDDLLLRDTGNLCEDIGHDINRVAYDHIFCIRSNSSDLRCDLLKDVYVCLGQFDSGLTRLAGNS